jgi:tetratricopeptide (TPR) repeat protein
MGEWDLAAEAFGRAVSVSPGYAEAWAYLGEARQHTGEDGFPDLSKAHEIDPGSLAVNTFLALYWQRAGDYPRALAHLDAGLAADPDNPSLLAEMGNTYALSGDLDSARVHYERAVESAPSDPRFWRAMAVFSITHEYQLRETGLPAASQAIKLAPKDPASLDVMAQVLFLLGNPGNAQRFLELAIAADPSYADAHLHLALLYLEDGETDLAYQELNKASSLASTSSPTSEHARRLLEQLFPH